MIFRIIKVDIGVISLSLRLRLKTLTLNEKKDGHDSKWVENVIKQLVHTSACVLRDMKRLGSLESTQQTRVTYASFVLSKLPACFISR